MMARYRYYYLERPPAPGCQPRRGLVGMVDFNGKKYFQEIARSAWGWCEYDRELSDEEVEAFELAKSGKIYR